MTFNEQRLLSRPFRVEWAGFESTTLRLQSQGWSFGAYVVDNYRRAVRIAMKHGQLQLYAQIAEMDWEVLYRGTFLHEGDGPTLRVQGSVGSDIYIQGMPSPSFTPIDMEPVFTEEPGYRMSELDIFAPQRVPEQEILFEKADMSVVEHLEAIKRLQSEKQRELREKARKAIDRAEADNIIGFPKQKTVASLVELSEAV